MTLQEETRAWAVLSIGALAIAGIFAILLVMSRTPVVQDLLPFPWKEFFQKGLVTHVIFSFVVWFLGTMGAILAYALARIQGPMTKTVIGPISLILAGLAFICLFMPALLNMGDAQLNNYVPVMNHPVYYTGLGILAFSLALISLRQLTFSWWKGQSENRHMVGTDYVALIYLVALCCFLIAWQQVPTSLEDLTYNERIFWGGGHVLQFVNTGLLIAVWVAIIRYVAQQEFLSDAQMIVAFVLLAFFCAPSPFIYFEYDVLGLDHRLYFSHLLAYGLPISATLATVFLILFLLSPKGHAMDKLTRISLWLSLVTFNLGGLYGILLDGSDTRVPAHYHSIIGGINLAFMVFYHRVILPYIGISLPQGKWTKRGLHLQYWFYGVGQIMHATGLFLAGRYGVARKTAGDAQGLDSFEKILSMGLMGVGGLIAVIGGAIFVFMTLKWLFQSYGFQPKDQSPIAQAAE